MNEKSLESRIAEIESRNLRVESNKKWETSLLRRSSIAVLTYATVVFYHWSIGAENIFVISVVPVIGFLLSTLSLQFIRMQFDKKQNEK